MAATAASRRSSFPALPAALTEAFDARDLRLRRFGASGEDLAIDLSAGALPRLVTAVLAACTERADGSAPPEPFFWALEAGTRVACLLRLVALDDVDELTTLAACANPACARPIEIALAIAELLALQEQRPEGPVAVGPLRLRRPTGEDQRSWGAMVFADAEAARLALLRTLTVAGGVEPAALDFAAIEAALDDADPLVDFSLTAQCPFCAQGAQVSVDLAALALARLRQAQGGLIETVHLLATRYHWSEPQILSIPLWRRARYLALIDRDGAA